ncbi:hypothetical protein EOL70_06420 [Leucothrix sargassi]|nr:hypothetical protein EOL70_06420 [Leucothrix sargassi]
MPAWEEYKQSAKARGALAQEFFVVETTVADSLEAVKDNLNQHLYYQQQLEREGKLVLAGPLSDATGELMQGNGLVIYRAASLEEARQLADNDPMHQSGARTYTLRRWLVNEGSISLNVGLSTGVVRLE